MNPDAYLFWLGADAEKAFWEALQDCGVIEVDLADPQADE